MLLDLVALESRFKILLGDTPFVSFLPEQLVISRFPSNFREIFLTGFLLTGGNFVESLWGSDICPTRMGIFLHVNLYSCIWSVENILCGGHHVTTAFDVLRDRCLTLTKVRFSGGPRTGKERRIGSVWKMVDFKSSLKSPCLSWLCKRTSSLRWSCIPLTDLFVDLIAWEGGARFLYDNHIAKEPKPMKPRMSSFRRSILNGLFRAFRWWNDSKQRYNVGGVKKRGSSGSSFIRSRLRSLFLSPAIFAPFFISLRFTH